MHQYTNKHRLHKYNARPRTENHLIIYMDFYLHGCVCTQHRAGMIELLYLYNHNAMDMSAAFRYLIAGYFPSSSSSFFPFVLASLAHSVSFLHCVHTFSRYIMEECVFGCVNMYFTRKGKKGTLYLNKC